MKVIDKKRENNRLSLKIEADYQDIIDKSNHIFKEEVKKYNIPGFRKGKASREAFEMHFGKGYLLEKALNDVALHNYFLAIAQEKEFPVDYPDKLDLISFEEGKPFVYKIEVTVKPQVELKKYKKLKAEVKKQEFSPEDVETALNQAREQMAQPEETDQPAKVGDIIEGQVIAKQAGQEIDSVSQDNWATRLGLGRISKDFEDQLIGLHAGESKSFTLSFDDKHDNADLKGKTVDFTFKMQKVKRRMLPELDDEFARKVSDSDNMQDLRSKLTENIKQQKEQQLENAIRDEVTEELLQANPVDVPDAMTKQEAENMLQQLKEGLAQRKMDFDLYLKTQQKTVEDLMTEFQEPARKKVALMLILEAIAQAEDIVVTDEELAEENKRIAEQVFQQPYDKVKDQLASRIDYIKDMLKLNKAQSYVVEQAKVKLVK